MSSGLLEVTLVSASFSPYISFESEPSDTYALLRCTSEQHSTKHAQDHGRLPVWNETFKFHLQQRDMSSELLIQVFNVRAEADELLGLARIPIYSMMGHEEATLCALMSPTEREVGKLKAAWKWKSETQASFKASSFQERVSGRQDYIEKESYTSEPFDPNQKETYTSEPFDPNQPYRSLKATSGEGRPSEMHGFSGGGSYSAEAVAAFDVKVPPYGSDSGAYAYPHVQNSGNTISEPLSTLDTVSHAMAKLAVDKEGSGRSGSSWEDSSKSGKGAKTEGDGYYHEAYATSYGAYHSQPAGRDACSADVKAREEGRGDVGAYSSSSAVYARGHSDHFYSQPSAHAGNLQTDTYPPHSGTSYAPAPDAFPMNKDNYPHHPSTTYPPLAPDTFPQDKGGYPPSTTYPPLAPDTFPQDKGGYPPSTTYPPLAPEKFSQDQGGYPPHPGASGPPAYSGSFPQNKNEYASNNPSPTFPTYSSPAYPPYPDHQSSSYSDVHSQGMPHMEKGGGTKEKGGGGKEKGGHKKEKEKGHGSHAAYGQPPAAYPYPPAPHGYPPAPHGYPPAPQGHPPPSHGYPPAVHGYPPSQGYPPAPHGYPSSGPPPGAPLGYPPPGAPHGYPPAPQGYPPHGYPTATQHSVAPPHGYPSFGHSAHHPDKHGHGVGYGAPGAYVGHSSSGSKPSKHHKDHKDSSSYKHGKHGKHKKQKSFKGLKFKKFKF